MAGLAGETRFHIRKTESYSSRAGSPGQGPLVRIALQRFSSAAISNTRFPSPRRSIMVLFAVSTNGLNIFVRAVGCTRACP